jgi:hypothetical protein
MNQKTPDELVKSVLGSMSQQNKDYVQDVSDAQYITAAILTLTEFGMVQYPLDEGVARVFGKYLSMLQLLKPRQ